MLPRPGASVPGAQGFLIVSIVASMTLWPTRQARTEQCSSTSRRKNEPHFDGRSRCERLAGHGPLERLGKGAVEVGDEGFDARLQVVLGGEAGAPQQLAHEDGEPDLDLVEPGGMLGREVTADAVAGVAQECFARGH